MLVPKRFNLAKKYIIIHCAIILNLLMGSAAVSRTNGYPAIFEATVISINKAGYIELDGKWGRHWLHGVSNVDDAKKVSNIFKSHKVKCEILGRSLFLPWVQTVVCRDPISGGIMDGDIGMFLFKNQYAVPLCPDAREYYGYCVNGNK